MKNDDEFERLLGEIPHATSSPLNNQYAPSDANHLRNTKLVDHHGYGHASCVSRGVNGDGHPMYEDDPLWHKYARASSPVSGFSLQSDGSSSSLFSGSSDGLSLTGMGPPSLPEIEVLNDYLIPGNGFWLDFRKGNDDSNFLDDFLLSRNFSKMYISDEPDFGPELTNSFQSCNRDLNGASLFNLENYGRFDKFRKCVSDFNHLPVPRGPPMNFGLSMAEMQPRADDLLGSCYSPGRPEKPFPLAEFGSSPLSPRFYRTNGNGNLPLEIFMSEVSPSPLKRPPAAARGTFNVPSVLQLARLSLHCNEENTLLNNHPSLPHVRNHVPHRSNEPGPFTRDNSLIIQGEEVINHGTDRLAHSRGHNGTRSLHREQNMMFSCPSPLSSGSLAEIRGYIYQVAKDQNGCRFLQKIFDEGTFLDVQIVFEEIFDHVVELMMNPFGNYLMQKFLEVCTEKQRMHILLRVTEEPGEIVRISLNTHGTRVVQKLIEMLKTRQQILIFVSAIEPGFLALIKDLNGNHVVQRCLQCFSAEDSKFIFIAAAKYCVDIATHQHGCCVLQRCINHATGELRENLVEEISANGLLLAQDAYGNYVVQFILELKIPSATSKLTSQFEGHYLHLSKQKFSSHVVEKCLLVCNDEIRSKIIKELLLESYFEQLLQDPHANYVLQTALRVTEGHLHFTLVEAIESYKAISHNSPYSKRIFSHKLLRR